MTIDINGYKVNEVPASAMKYAYIVAREHADAMWYWGAFRKEEDALECAREINGVVIPTAE